MSVNTTRHLIATGDVRKQATPLSHDDTEPLSGKRYLLTSCVDHLIRSGLNYDACKQHLFVAPTSHPFITAPADIKDLKTKQEGDTILYALGRRLKKRISQFRIFWDAETTFIFPVVESSHYFVLEVVVDISDPKFYKSAKLFDSLRRPTRARASRHTDSTVFRWDKTPISNIDAWFHVVFVNIRDEPNLAMLDSLCGLVEYYPCPHQRNLIDCSLCAAGVTLHLAEGLPIDENCFAQASVTQLRNELADWLGARRGKDYFNLIRRHYSIGTEVEDSKGDEENSEGDKENKPHSQQKAQKARLQQKKAPTRKKVLVKVPEDKQEEEHEAEEVDEDDNADEDVYNDVDEDLEEDLYKTDAMKNGYDTYEGQKRFFLSSVNKSIMTLVL